MTTGFIIFLVATAFIFLPLMVLATAYEYKYNLSQSKQRYPKYPIPETQIKRQNEEHVKDKRDAKQDRSVTKTSSNQPRGEA